jgi:acetolactate synthase-1/2/3 large subunit
MNAERLTTGQAVVKSLRRHGVNTLFGIPGAHTYDLFDALYEAREEIRFITTRHEQAAGYMAYGYAKATGRVGAFCVVPGPGILNAGAAMCTALGACAQTLCVTGEIPSQYIGRGRGILHELPDQLATLESFNKWAGRIDHPSQAAPVVAEAFRRMRQGRPGPAAIEVPWDVLGQRALVDLDVLSETVPPPPPDPDAVDRAVKLISEARNPMITVGAGALDAGSEIQALAELLQAPVAAHRSGRGIVGEDTPYGFSCGAAALLWPETDLVIGIGSRLELQHIRWQWQPRGVKYIRIDIDPTEFVRLPPEVGLVCDAADGTAALVNALAKTISKRASRAQEFSWVKAKAAESFKRVQPQIDYLAAIRDVLPRDGYLVEEVSQMGFAARFGFPVYAPRTYVTCGYQDNLGFGFNTALGVKVAHPRKPVVAIAGDGGILYGIQELATAAQYGIELVTCVFNNGGFGNVRRDQMERYGGRVIGADLINPDFVKLAESFGVAAYRVRRPAELRGRLETALAAGAPVVIEVMVERGSEVTPWQFLHPRFPGPAADSAYSL